MTTIKNFFSSFKPHIVQFNDGTFAIRKRGISTRLKYYSIPGEEWYIYKERVFAKTYSLKAAVEGLASLSKPFDKDEGRELYDIFLGI